MAGKHIAREMNRLAGDLLGDLSAKRGLARPCRSTNTQYENLIAPDPGMHNLDEGGQIADHHRKSHVLEKMNRADDQFMQQHAG